jgi:hypothetical protein
MRKPKTKYRERRDAERFAGLPLGGILPALVPKTPTQQPLACSHRGDEIRREQCPNCSGVVQVKIHSCDLHGECTLSGKLLPGVRNCGECPDRP